MLECLNVSLWYFCQLLKLLWLQRQVFTIWDCRISNLENGKGTKASLSFLVWPPGHLFQESRFGSNELSDTTGCRQVFVPTGSVGARFELNPQILDTWDVNKGQTGLKYKVTGCSMFCLLKQLCQRLWLWIQCIFLTQSQTESLGHTLDPNF